MFRIGAIQFELGFQWDTVCKAAFNALFYAVTGRVDEIIQKLQYKVVPRIRNRKILREYFVKTFIDTILRVGLQLEKILE